MTIDLGNRLLLRTAEERVRIEPPSDEQFKRPLVSVSIAGGVIESRLGGPSGLEIMREEAPEVSRQIQWPTREQVEAALAEHETQAQVTAALGLRAHQLRTAVERVGLVWPWQGAGKPRLDRVPETAPKTDKPAPADPEPSPAPVETAAAEPAPRVVVNQTTAKAEASADVGDVPLGPPPQLAGTPDHGGLLIELPQTTLDRNSVDRLLSQLRDTITTASSVVGGEVELQLTARVGVGARG